MITLYRGFPVCGRWGVVDSLISVSAFHSFLFLCLANMRGLAVLSVSTIVALCVRVSVASGRGVLVLQESVVNCGSSVRVTRSIRVGPVARVTGITKVNSRCLRRCKGCGTGVSVSVVSGDAGGNGLVLIATVAPAPTNRNGAAAAVNLTSNVGGVNGGIVITLHRPSLNPIFNVGNNTTNNNCTRMIPVRSVGLRFANSFRTVNTTGGLLTTVVTGRVCRNGTLGVSPHEVA